LQLEKEGGTSGRGGGEKREHCSRGDVQLTNFDPLGRKGAH